MILYCPKCGESSEIEPFDVIAPYTTIFLCPNCDTYWNLDFYEIDKYAFNNGIILRVKDERV